MQGIPFAFQTEIDRLVYFLIMYISFIWFIVLMSYVISVGLITMAIQSHGYLKNIADQLSETKSHNQFLRERMLDLTEAARVSPLASSQKNP